MKLKPSYAIKTGKELDLIYSSCGTLELRLLSYISNANCKVSFNKYLPLSIDLLLHLIKSVKKETFNFRPLVKDVSCQFLHLVHLLCFELYDALELRDFRS